MEHGERPLTGRRLDGQSSRFRIVIELDATAMQLMAEIRQKSFERRQRRRLNFTEKRRN